MPADRRRNGLFLTSSYSESYHNNLTHPINPVFNFDLWRQPGSRECLEPVLRLASVLLESPASQRFIYSRLCTEHVRTTSTTGRLASCHFRRALESEDEVERGFRETMLFVAKRITYAWADGLGDALGRTESLERCNESTYSCIIQIDRRRYEQIFHKPVRPGDDSKLSRYRFHLAVTLCHEVAHAIDWVAPSRCKSGWDDTNHFFENSPDYEFGFAWEDEVFKFTVERMVPYRETAINLALAYPVTPYRQILALPRTRRPSTLGPAGYAIPIDYITRIQRDNFWKRSRRTMTMLRIPAKIEFRSSRLLSDNSLELIQLIGKDAATRETTVTVLLSQSPKSDKCTINQEQVDQQSSWRFLGVVVPPNSSGQQLADQQQP